VALKTITGLLPNYKQTFTDRCAEPSHDLTGYSHIICAVSPNNKLYTLA